MNNFTETEKQAHYLIFNREQTSESCSTYSQPYLNNKTTLKRRTPESLFLHAIVTCLPPPCPKVGENSYFNKTMPTYVTEALNLH